jgi:RND family efflux transporter MFP subunit
VTARFSLIAAGLLLPCLLAACGESPRETVVPRTVLLTDVAPAPATVRTVTAEIRQARRARLSFDVAGRIASIAVQPGDAFVQGQVLAHLDPEPIRLRLVQARAEAASAHAEAADRAEQLRQQQALFDDGSASKSTLAMARAADEAARGKAAAADATVALAARDLAHGALVAPFAGHVVSRAEEPDHDVAAGQAVLTIDGEGQFEAVAAVPASLREALRADGAATLVAADTTPVPVRLTQLSDHEDKGATVQAIFRTAGAPAVLAAGQLLPLRLNGGVTGPLAIPLTALVPGGKPGGDAVFVYDAPHGQVHRKPVGVAGRAGDRVVIGNGLAAGDKVVVAGTAFLVDGQAVHVFDGGSQLETR